MVFQTEAGSFTYQVRGIIIVDGEAIDIAAQSYAHTATLFACHPPGSAAQRIVAKLRLLGPDGQPVDPEAALPPLEAGTQAGDHTLLMRSADPLSTAGGYALRPAGHGRAVDSELAARRRSWASWTATRCRRPRWRLR